MTIEIHNPELEALLEEHLKAGRFASVEDLLIETFKGKPNEAVAHQEELKTRAQNAALRIRELRKGVALNRPEGTSLRDYAHIGHRY